MKISILQGSSSGTAVYVETHTPTTNANGLATIEIGNGSIVTGVFANIKWSTGPYYLKTETDPEGGTSYTITGTSQLLSVPYALYSREVQIGSSKWSESGSDIYFNSGKVGIGKIPGGGESRQFQVLTNTFQAIAGQSSGTLGTIYAENLADGPAGDFRNNGTGDGIKSTIVTAGKTGIVSTAPTQGIFGYATAASGITYGVQGNSASATGSGVIGYGSSTTGFNFGVKGIFASISGTGVYGFGRYGMEAETDAENGYGISIKCTHSTGVTRGIYVSLSSPNGYSGYFSGGNTFYVATDLGIGTLTPAYKLDVAGPANLNKGLSGIALRCNGDEAIWYNGTYFSWGYGGSYNYFGDKIFVGAAAADPGTNLLVVNGAAAKPGGGSWETWSDARLKDIHGIYSKGLKEIISLKPVSFSYKAGNKPNLPTNVNYTGLIAQEVQDIFPEAVSPDGNGFLQLDLQPVNMALINAIKDLKAENDRLKSENENIKSRLEKIERLLKTKTN